MASLFNGIIAFPAFARQLGSEERAEPPGNMQEETRTDSREEIKARLLRQIMYEDWDPYGADISMDEFTHLESAILLFHQVPFEP